MGRLTNLPPDQLPASAEGAADLNFRLVSGKVLVTNAAGCHAQLEPAEFGRLAEGTLPAGGRLTEELRSKGFVRGGQDLDALSRAWRQKNAFLWSAPALHIVVVSLRCNHKCLYCHASVVGEDKTDLDMTLETARRTVDFIFQTPRKGLAIEFQGGEPLLNWPVVRFIAQYARAKAAKEKRTLRLALVSNLSLMTEERAAFLAAHGVHVCTSLDGPEDLHNKNRIWRGGTSYGETVKWIRYYQAQADERAKGPERHDRPGALLTTTRLSFEYSKEIVDTYVSLGLPAIYIRPLSPIGFARRVWDKIGYTSEQFLEFHRRTLDRIIDVNLSGTRLLEQGATTLLTKILRLRDFGHVDVRSPSGGGLGVLGYNYDGTVFTGDEGRMLAQEGNELFRLGTVDDAYNAVVSSAINRMCAVATTLEAQPLCSQCAYKPYCSVCPVFNVETQGSLWGHMPSNGRCRNFMGIFDYLFERMREPKVREVFESWVGQA